MPLAGHLKHFLKSWKILIRDQETFSAVKGHNIVCSNTVAIWTTALLPYLLFIWKAIESEKVCFSQTQSLITVC